MAQKRVPTTSKVRSMLNERGLLAAVLDKDLATPPSTPNSGDRYIVGASATGDWSGHDNEIAEYDGSAWQFTTPVEGMQVFVKDEDDQYFYNGSAWFKPYSESTGDMEKSTYDTNDNGIVDKAEQLDDGSGNTATPSEIRTAIDTDIPTLQSGKADKVSGATAGNFAGLDSNGNLTDSGVKKDDTSTTTSNVWSASKIQNELDGKSDVGHNHDSRYYQKSEFISTSSGATDAGKPVVLDADGNVDASMINDADIDHNNIQNNGTYTHTQIDSHIDSTSNPHSVSLEQVRSQNNQVSGDIDMNGNKVVNLASPTASADAATKAYVDGLVQGLDWQDSVLDKDLTAPQSGTSAGDRYIVASGATGDWYGHDNEIAEYDGSAWTFEIPNEGAATWVEDEDKLYVYNGSSWVKFGSTVDHGSLIGLGDDDHPQYLNTARGDARYYTQTQLDGGQLDSRYYTETETDSLLNNKADKVSGATNGNLAGLDSNGNLTDSGVAASNVFDKSADSLDDIADGTTYGRVKQTELSNGNVSRLNDGTNVATAAEAKKAYDTRAKYDASTDEIVFENPDTV